MEQQEETKENFPPQPAESKEAAAKRERREAIFEMALFLVLGILLGITIKTEAAKRITIGFNDYKIANGKNSYNIEDIKKNLQAQADAQQAAQQQSQPQQ